MGDEETAEYDSVMAQRRVIEECLKVVGPTGLPFYRLWYETPHARG